MGEGLFAHVEALEAEGAEEGSVEAIAGVEHEGGFAHGSVDALPIELGVVLPVGHDDDGIGVGCGLVGVFDELHMGDVGEVFAGVGEGLGVGDGDAGVFLVEETADAPGGGFARVAGVGLEGKAKDGDFLVGEGVEEGLKQARDDALLLVFVHVDDAHPVLGLGSESEGFAEVDEVEDVFFEATSAKAGSGFEEFCADAAVGSDDAGDLFDVGSRGFAEAGDGIDGGDALGEEGVGGELGELGAPDVGGEDALAWDPGGVHLDDLFHGGFSGVRFGSADEDAIGVEEVFNGGSFREEFGVA